MVIELDDLVDKLKEYFNTDVSTNRNLTIDDFRVKQGYKEVIDYIYNYNKQLQRNISVNKTISRKV